MNEKFKPHTYEGETPAVRPPLMPEELVVIDVPETTPEQQLVRDVLQSINEPLLKGNLC